MSCSGSAHRPELRHAARNLRGHAQQGGEQCIVDLDVTLVLGEIALPMGLVEHSPLFGCDPQRVLQTLKDDVSVLRPIPMPAQSGERKRMCGVVGQVEATLAAERRLLGVAQANRAGADQAVDLRLRSGLGLELADANKVVEL